MNETPDCGWAWDVSLIVAGMPVAARAEFRRELSRAMATSDADSARLARCRDLHEALALRAAQDDQFAEMISRARIERVDPE